MAGRDYAQDKESIKFFLTEFCEPNECDAKIIKYAKQLKKLAHREQIKINIDLDDLHEFNESLAAAVIQNTRRYSKLFSDIILELLPSYKEHTSTAKDSLDVYIEHRLLMESRFRNSNENRDPSNRLPFEVIKRIDVTFKTPNLQKPISIREVKADYVGKLVSVRDNFIKMGRVIPHHRKGAGSVFVSQNHKRKGADKLRPLDYAGRYGYVKSVLKEHQNDAFFKKYILLSPSAVVNNLNVFMMPHTKSIVSKMSTVSAELIDLLQNNSAQAQQELEAAAQAMNTEQNFQQLNNRMHTLEEERNKDREEVRKLQEERNKDREEVRKLQEERNKDREEVRKLQEERNKDKDEFGNRFKAIEEALKVFNVKVKEAMPAQVTADETAEAPAEEITEEQQQLQRSRQRPQPQQPRQTRKQRQPRQPQQPRQ